jgi:hypothetical protein
LKIGEGRAAGFSRYQFHQTLRILQEHAGNKKAPDANRGAFFTTREKSIT